MNDQDSTDSTLPRPITLTPVYQPALDHVTATPALHSTWQAIAEYDDPTQAYNARVWLTKKYDYGARGYQFSCKREGSVTVLAVKYDPE